MHWAIRLGSASISALFAPDLRAVRQESVWVMGLIAAAVVLAGGAYLVRNALRQPVPLSLSLRENGGQLRIGWSRDAAAGGATLEILDGRLDTTVLVEPPLADVTYAVRGTDVQVRLTPSAGYRQVATASYLVPDPPIPELETEFAELFLEVHSLQIAMARQSRRISRLENAAQIIARRIDRPKPPRHGKVETWWWR